MLSGPRVGVPPAAAKLTLRNLLRKQPSIGAVFAYFAIAGVGSVMLGPTLPLLALRWKMPDAQLGTLFFTFFAGQFLGAWNATPRLRTSLLAGSLISACGLILLGYASATTAHLALFCVGLGLGAGLTAGNVTVGTIGGEEASAQKGQGSLRSRLLALLNVSWGCGAIACPLLVAATLRVHAEPGRIFFLTLAMALIAWLGIFGTKLGRAAAGASRPALASGIPWNIYALFGATLVLYVGVENSLAGWLPTYARRMAAPSSWSPIETRASSIALCFWIFELASRSLTAVFLHLTTERLLYRLCLLLLLTIALVLALVPLWNVWSIFAVTAIAAITMGPIFPLAVSFLLARTGNHPRLGKVFAASSLGGTILPWLTGIFSTRSHSLRVGLGIPAAGAALLLLLSIYLPNERQADADLEPDV